MRRLMLSTVALTALAGVAFAGDLPSIKGSPVYYAPAPVFSWTGFYGGIEGGADFLSTKYDALPGQFFAASNDVTAGLLGGLVGYNYQINNFVLGIEGDGGGILGASRTIFVPGPNGGWATSNSDYFADLRGRLGLAYDRYLFYVAGGVAFGDVNSKYYNSRPGPLYGQTNSDRTGWTIGGGVDYAFTPNWIGRVEYRYTNLGDNFDNVIFTHVNNDSNAVLAAFIYKFGVPEPIVARY